MKVTPEPTDWRAADAKYEALIPGRPGHIYINRPAQAILQYAIKETGEKASDFYGVTMGPETARSVYDELRTMEQTERDESVAFAIAGIREAMEQASGDSHVLTFLDGDSATPFKETRTARFEEEFHRQQFLRSIKDPRTEHVDAERALADPEIAKAVVAVKARRGVTSDQSAFRELGAILASNSGAEIGLAPPESAKLFHAYTRELIQQHGESMRDIVNYAHPYIRKETLRLRAEEERRGNGGPSKEIRGPANSPEGGPERPVYRPADSRVQQAPSLGRRLLTEETGSLDVKQLAIATREAGKLLTVATDDIVKWLAPASREGAQPAALAMRNRAAEFARSQARAEKALDAVRVVLAKMPVAARWEFYDRAENGLPEPNANLAPIASLFRKLLDSARKDVQDLGTGKLQNFIENYLPHIYKKANEAEKIFRSYYAKRPMEGKKSFLKRRKFETLKDAMDAGLEPVSDNPVDMVALKLAEMNRYVMAHRVLNDLKAKGVVQYVRAGQAPPPGYQRIDDKVATVFGPPTINVQQPAVLQSSVGQIGGGMGPQQPGAQYTGTKTAQVPVPGIRIMGQYYAPEPAARIINNFLSPGLRETSPLFRGYLSAANAMNQFQLGFSAFHWGFTSMDTAVSKVALGIYQAAHGHPVQGLISAAQFPIAPFMGLVKGDKMLREYYKSGSQAAQIGDLVDAMVIAGGRARMDSFYASKVSQRMMDAFRASMEPGRNVFSRGQKVAAGVLRSPFALAEQTVKPILEWIVPRQKMAVFADLAQFELQRLSEGRITPEELPAALARAWDSVDNRLGQLVYDNLFWHKVTKDLLMGSVRSVGWNTGTIREILGGTADVRKLLPSPVPEAQMPGSYSGWQWKPDVSTRLSYLPAMAIVVGMAGALLYYLFHGKPPDKLEDYYVIPDSKGNKVWLPSYVKDVLSVAHEGPLKVAKGKVHPFLTSLAEMLTNKDYFDRPIANADDPIVKRYQERVNFALQQMTPMSFKKPQGKRAAPLTLADKLRQQVGITRVPAAVAHPERKFGTFHPANEKSPYNYPLAENFR